MSYKVSCFLPLLRSEWKLSQDELADLLKVSRQHISDLEKELTDPEMGVLMGLEILFGLHPKEIFLKRFDEIEEKIVGAIYEFQQDLVEQAAGGEETPENARKRQLMGEALSRAVLETKRQPGYGA